MNMVESRIKQISLPGGSGRIPTGAIQFQDDWPGLFVRGDDALALLSAIRELAARVGDHADPVVAGALDRLQRIAAVIEQDVRVRL